MTVEDERCRGMSDLSRPSSSNIERNDEPAVVADLQIGDEAMAEYNTVTMVAKKIEVYIESDAGAEPPPDGN